MRWLDRDTVRAPFVTLCLSEQAYRKAAKHCKVEPDPWMDIKRDTAVVHTWEMDTKLVCVVCLNPKAVKADPIEVACTLVHESVHIFQRLCDSIGESQPSREFEAYSIERITERLMREFVRQSRATAPLGQTPCRSFANS